MSALKRPQVWMLTIFKKATDVFSPLSAREAADDFWIKNSNYLADPLAFEKSRGCFPASWSRFSQVASKSVMIFIMKISYNDKRRWCQNEEYACRRPQWLNSRSINGGLIYTHAPFETRSVFTQLHPFSSRYFGWLQKYLPNEWQPKMLFVPILILGVSLYALNRK